MNLTNDITSPPLEETIMIRNRVTLDDIPGMAVGEIAALPMGQLALLAEEARKAADEKRAAEQRARDEERERKRREKEEEKARKETEKLRLRADKEAARLEAKAAREKEKNDRKLERDRATADRASPAHRMKGTISRRLSCRVFSE